MGKRAFGELENAILYLLKSGERKTVKEIHKALGEKNSYNTVMTVMSRLFEKKHLARAKVGLHYEYWTVDTAESSFLNRLKQRFLGIKTSVLVSHLIESAEDLTDEDLVEMEKLVQKARRAKK
ncbi:MAG: BlaI/MecI/CopY family transcriptional regulator [Chlamydiota bacterium]